MTDIRLQNLGWTSRWNVRCEGRVPQAADGQITSQVSVREVVLTKETNEPGDLLVDDLPPLPAFVEPTDGTTIEGVEAVDYSTLGGLGIQVAFLLITWSTEATTEQQEVRGPFLTGRNGTYRLTTDPHHYVQEDRKWVMAGA